MKIGILTWYSACNYGARAHSFALRKTIESLGHECVMVAYRPINEKRVNFRSNVGINHIYLHPHRMLKAYLRCRKFENQISMNPVSKQVFTGEDIDHLGLDLLILGSDEIFNVSHLTFNPIYYGVGITKVPIITYAPSSGQCDVNQKLSLEIRQSLKRILTLSARDRHTSNLIYNNINKEAEIVADPTILYDFETECIKPKWNKYILIYAFDDWNEYRKEIIKFAHEKNLKVLSLGQYRKWADINYDLATLPEWLGTFKYADFVITDSFHGTVFATKYHKQFCLLGRSDKLNKINNFLLDAGIEREFYASNITLNEYFSNTIDFSVVDKNLDSLREKSLKYLKNAIMMASKR